MSRQMMGKQHKVISSGRLTGKGRGQSAKRNPSVGRQNSLSSTDSEDQVSSIQKGLDCCAALLNGILQAEKTDTKSPSPNGGRAASVRPKAKLTPAKVEHHKKKPVKRLTAVMQPHKKPAVQKTILSSQSSCAVGRRQCSVASQTAIDGPVVASSANRGVEPSLLVHADNPLPTCGRLPTLADRNSAVCSCGMMTSTPTLSPQKPNNRVCGPPAEHQPLVTEEDRDTSTVGTPAANSDYGDGSTCDAMRGVDVLPVRDSGCATNPDTRQLCSETRNTNPAETAKKVLTVKGLLGELKTLVVNKGDHESLCLIAEVEQSVDLLPTLVGSTNIQAEIALFVQPLRNENVQLRRRLRILNQQLAERERAERQARPADCNFELMSLESMNVSLQNQLRDSHNEMELLQRKNNELLQENQRLQQVALGRDKELQQCRLQGELDVSRFKIEVTKALAEVRSCEVKLEACEKEKSALAMRAEQKDVEIKKLIEEARVLIGTRPGTSKMCHESDASKPPSHLSKTILGLFDDEQKQASPLDPAAESVNMYLKTLELGSPPPPALSPSKTNAHMQQDKLFPPKPRATSSFSNTIPNREAEQGRPSGVALEESQKPDLAGRDAGLSEDRNASPLGILPQSCIPNGVLGTSKSWPSFQRPASTDPPPSCSTCTERSPTRQPRTSLGENQALMTPGSLSALNSTITSCESKSLASNLSVNSWSTFNTQDEMDFRNGLAALDASIASLQKTIQSDLQR